MTSTTQGSILGGSLLITGSCVGAGMLGLPILTGFAGLVPSIGMFFLAWALMTGTALLLVEVNHWFKEGSNFPTMIKSLLGPFFQAVCFIIYLVLFYSLLVAYIADSGIHFAGFLKLLEAQNVQPWVGSTFFVAIFGWMVYLGTKPVDLLNRGLMILKILAFLILVIMGAGLITKSNLLYSDIKYTLFPLPILVISFGFHNMIPTVTHYLGDDIKRVRKSILFGSLFTLSIYILWLLVTLGSIPVTGPNSITSTYIAGTDAAMTLQMIYPSVALPAAILAFAAILTSFLAQSISVAHFLCDGLNVKDKNGTPFWIILLTFIPPLLITWIYPDIFYKALSFGGMLAVVLFGIFPVAMAYKGRYIENRPSSYRLFGGKITLALLGLFSLFIILYRLLHHLGLELFPSP